jgi:Zn-finger domain-containing protein
MEMHDKKHLWKDNVAVQVISWTKKIVVLLNEEEATQMLVLSEMMFSKILTTGWSILAFRWSRFRFIKEEKDLKLKFICFGIWANIIATIINLL